MTPSCIAAGRAPGSSGGDALFYRGFPVEHRRNWIRYFAGGYRVQVLSTQPAAPMPGVELHALVDGTGQGRAAAKRRWAGWLDQGGSESWPGRWLGWGRDHAWLPATALRLTGRARRLVEQLQPDLLHSLRIPIEGQIGGGALAGALAGEAGIPHIVSAWGNDFTLFAGRSRAQAWLTRRALAGCAGFMADAEADLARARCFGLRPEVPVLVVPGAGGVDTGIFRPPGGREESVPVAVPAGARLIVNARGFRSYVRNDTFLRAAATVAARHGDVYFVCAGLAGWRPAEALVAHLGIQERVRLTGPLSQRELAALHRRSAVMVSPTEHDGTPNTLLEAMACGALPVCGDLPSIREWIDDGVNGLLVRVDRAEPIAEAMLRALEDTALAQRARKQGPALVACRAEYSRSMARAEEFYRRVLAGRRSGAVWAELDLAAPEWPAPEWPAPEWPAGQTEPAELTPREVRS